MPAPATRILHEDREILVVHRPAASDATLITFSDLTFRPSGLEFWGGEAAEKLGLDAIGFVAKRENWFPTASVEAAAAAVRAVLKPRSLTYGYSMGGHGALKHAARLGARGCLAVAPQISIAPAETPWDPRYHRYHRPRLHAEMMVTAADLAPFTAILADPYDTVDWAHAQAAAALGPVHLLRAPLLGHAVIWLLAGSEPLGAVLRPAFEGDAGALRAALRANRARSTHWFRLMGRAAYRRGHEQLAEALWSRGEAMGMTAAALRGDRVGAQAERIELLIERGRRRDAVVACRALERLAPRAAPVVARAAHLLLAAGALPPAEAAFGRALALKPDAADLHLGLSLALSGQGRPAEALDIARKGHAAQPGDIELATHLGHLLNAGTPAERGEAEAVFRAVLAQHPGTGRALLGLSSVLAGRGELPQALGLAQKAVTRLPGDLDAIAWLARLLLDTGHVERAERMFRRILRLAPRRADGYLGLADTLHATGRKAEAIAMLDQGLARLPDEPGLAARRAVLTAPPAPPRRRATRWLRRLFGWMRRGRAGA